MTSQNAKLINAIPNKQIVMIINVNNKLLISYNPFHYEFGGKYNATDN